MVGGYIIYALVDPHDDSVRYVGITDNIFNRLLNHLREAGSRTSKGAWLADLLRQGLQPTVITLEEVKVRKDHRYVAEERERYWIKHFEQSGASLLNISHTATDPRLSPKRRRESPTYYDLPPDQLRKRKRPKDTYTVDQLRKQAGLWLEELADLAQISRTTLRRIMRGEAVNRPQVDRVLWVLSDRLGRRITLEDVRGLNIVE